MVGLSAVSYGNIGSFRCKQRCPASRELFLTPHALSAGRISRHKKVTGTSFNEEELVGIRFFFLISRGHIIIPGAYLPQYAGRMLGDSIKGDDGPRIIRCDEQRSSYLLSSRSSLLPGNKQRCVCTAPSFTALTFGSFCSAAYDVFDYVNPLIGTVNGGLCFCPRQNNGIERADHA